LRATPIHVLLCATVLSTVAVTTQITFAAGSNPLTVVFVRNSIGSIAIALFLLITRKELLLGRRDWLAATGIGLVLAFNNLTLNLALSRVSVPVAILTFYTYPVWMAVWGWLSGEEKFRPASAVGLLLALTGIALTLGVAPELPDPVGVGLALLSCFLWVAVLKLSEHHLGHTPPHARTLHMLAVSALAMLLMLLAFGTPALPHGAKALAALAWIPLAYGAGMLGLLWVNSRLGHLRTSFFMNFEPISSIGISALVLGQTLSPLQMVGAGLVVVSLAIFRPPPADAV
jgi:drug/metabolite transporter (DMT)-like permease